jgi:hypothetical protein
LEKQRERKRARLIALDATSSTWGDRKGMKIREPDNNMERPHMIIAYFLLWWLAKLKTFFLHFK